jgi:hypothetical protein
MSFRRRAIIIGWVHVGAHEGEEVRHASPPIRAWPSLASAIGDRTGTADLLLHSNQRGGCESASLFPISCFREIVATLTTTSAIQVPITRLDDLLRLRAEAMDRYNLL